MRNISDTIARLAALRRGAGLDHALGDTGRLTPLPEFGPNPGALKAYTYIPADLPRGAPLVVVLHGCTQTATGYDIGSGWSQMADRYGFALLFPEQQHQNNANLCFNWFSANDTRRGHGEALSIRQMIAAVGSAHTIDPARIFVTGLSAGGAMTSVMLATYPDVFAGGAIIAGLPFGCAVSVPQAFDRMRGHGLPVAAELSARVRAASDHRGPWPTISIWHGSTDATVSSTNARAIFDQWSALHGVASTPNRSETVDGYPHRVWCNGEGRVVIEDYTITGMGHGTPLDTKNETGCGKAGPFMLEVGISSTAHLCRLWGLAENAGRAIQEPRAAPLLESRELALAAPSPAAGSSRFTRVHTEPLEKFKTGPGDGVRKVIEDALRAAGLMK